MDYLKTEEIRKEFKNLNKPTIVAMEQREHNTMLQIAQLLEDVPSGRTSDEDPNSFSSLVKKEVNNGVLYTTNQRVPNKAVEKFGWEIGSVLDTFKIQVTHSFEPSYEEQSKKLTYVGEELMTAHESETGRSFYETTDLIKEAKCKHKIFQYSAEAGSDSTEETGVEAKMEESPLFG